VAGATFPALVAEDGLRGIAEARMLDRTGALPACAGEPAGRPERRRPCSTWPATT
jgi:hypothetical protein